MELLRLFTDNLLPIFLTAGAGYLLAARFKTDPRPISQVAFNVLAPCLTFRIVVESHVPVDALLRMSGFATVVLLGIGAVAFVICRMLGWSRPRTSAVVLSALLPNVGNFGLSANLLAFGQEGLAQASLFFVTASVITYTVGVLVASLGRAGPREALLGLVRVPAIWAVVIGLVLQRLGWTLPRAATSAIHLLADGCIPTMLVILGLQLHGARAQGPPGPIALACGLRLVGSAALALLLVPIFGLQGAARQAGVLQAAAPTAVITTIIATEYQVEPGLVTSVVLITTLLSPLTMTPLLQLLK